MDNELIAKIIELSKEYNVSKLILFGSSLDSFIDSNDVDLACDGLYGKNFFRFGSSLEKLLKKPVDLIPLQPSNDFISYIQTNGRILYESKIN